MNKKTYGIPYQGNKQRIAKDILNILPSGKRLVDLFGGGGAVTDYAITNYSNKWDNFLYNDINPLVTNLFCDAVNGKYNNYKPKWVSREEFDKYKDSDGYIKYVWSFGNNGNNYLFGKKIEEFKKNGHNYVVFGDKEALKYLENYYKDSYYWLIKDIYNDNDSINNNRLRFRNIILKLEAIKVCVEYGDTHIYNCFKDYSFNDFLNISQKLMSRVIDFCCPNIPKKNYKKTINKYLTFDEFNDIEYLKNNFNYYEYTKSHLNELRQLDDFDTNVVQLQGLERLEQLDDFDTNVVQLEQLQRIDSLDTLKHLENITINCESLQNLTQLKQLQGLQGLKINKLEISNIDYHKYEYKDGDVVYCDIPYKNTSNFYDDAFNHDEFFEWCSEQDYPIYVSEYSTNIIGEILWCKDKRSFTHNKRTETLQKIN